MRQSYRAGKLQYEMTDKWKADRYVFCNQQDVRLSDKRNFKPIFQSQLDFIKNLRSRIFNN